MSSSNWIGLAAVVGGWILYELYGRRFLEDWASYIRIGAGAITIIGLWWYAQQSSKNFTDTVDLAKQLLTEAKSTGGRGTREKRNVTNATKKVVGAKYKWKCAGCSETLDEGYQVDHIKPLYQGGTNEIDNLQPLCGNCHNRKTINERLNLNK